MTLDDLMVRWDHACEGGSWALTVSMWFPQGHPRPLAKSRCFNHPIKLWEASDSGRWWGSLGCRGPRKAYAPRVASNSGNYGSSRAE